MGEEKPVVRVAIAGVGHWGPNLLRNFHESDKSRVEWAIDSDPNRLAIVKKRFPEIKLAPLPEPALNDPNVDAVVVATPLSSHFAMARASLDKGKHVLVEKPLTDDTDRGLELCQLAHEKSLVLMVGHVFLFNPAVQKIKTYLEEGALGTVQYISMSRTNLGPIRLDANAAWDLGAHDISIANYWLGSRPLTVSAVGGVWINQGLEDAVFASIRYPNDVIVNMHVSWLNPRKSREITVVADKRMLTFDDMDMNEPIRIYDKQVTSQLTHVPYIDTHAEFRASIRDGDITIPKVALGEPLRSECEHFVACIQSGCRPSSDGRFGLEVVRTLAAIDRSLAQSGKEQPVC